MDALIEADGLSKKFGKVQALSDLSLTLKAGKPVAILGPINEDTPQALVRSSVEVLRD